MEKIKATLFIDYDRCGNVSSKQLEKCNKSILKKLEQFYGIKSDMYVPTLFINSDDYREVYNYYGWKELGIAERDKIPQFFPKDFLKGENNGDIIEITVMKDKELLLTIKRD